MYIRALLGVTVALIVVGAPVVQAEVVDQVLATVENEAILQSEIMAEIGPGLKELQAKASSQEAFNKALDERVRATLDQAIENKLLLREAQLAGLQIPDDIIEKQMDEFKKSFASNEEFLKELENAGETVSDLRARLKKQLMATQEGFKKRTEFEKAAVVSESDVAQYYQDHPDEFNRPERVRCRQIFLPAGPDTQARAAARAQLEEWLKQVQGGADFAELAKAHSQAPGAEDGGIIGWVSKGDLVPVLEEAALSLAEGGVSPILETENGVHVLKVDQKQAAGKASLDEARTEIEPKLRAQAAAERYKKWMDDLRKRSRVRVFLP